MAFRASDPIGVRINSTRFGNVALKARPGNAAIVWDHGEKFRFALTGFRSTNTVKDCQLHAILALEIHLCSNLTRLGDNSWAHFADV